MAGSWPETARLSAVYACATTYAHFVDTLLSAAENGPTPFQIYRVVLADAHSCR